jgi:hypothetical protein
MLDRDHEFQRPAVALDRSLVASRHVSIPSTHQPPQAEALGPDGTSDPRGLAEVSRLTASRSRVDADQEAIVGSVAGSEAGTAIETAIVAPSRGQGALVICPTTPA